VLLRPTGHFRTTARAAVAGLAGLAIAAATVIVIPTATAVPAPQAAPRPVVTGWFGWWASDPVITAMTSQADGVVGEVAMFWWSFQGAKNPLCVFDNGDYDNDGQWGECLTATDTPWTTAKFNRQRQMLQDAGIKINASITDLGSATARELTDYLATSKRRNAYATKITEYAVKAKVDGIDLDWENFAFNDGRDTWEATKPRWSAFIKALSKKLHKAGKTLWATVPGGVPPFSGSGAPNPGTGYWVYAWDEIAPYVDRLNIMTYDYSWSIPGPIGPNDWATLVADSAVQQIGTEYAEKVWVGAPQYGRNWPVQSGSGWMVDADCPSGWTPKRTPTKTTVTPASARDLAAREKVKPSWDAEAGEWSFQYWSTTAGKVDKKAKRKAKRCEVKREVWFADTRSAIARAKITPQFRIGGIAVWDFGTVNSDFYSRLADYGREIAPAPTTVSVAAPKKAAHGSTLKIKVTTDSRVGAAKLATARLTFAPTSGGAARTEVASIVLDKDGSGAFTVPAEVSGSWVVSVDGDWSRKAGSSDSVTTRVRYAVTSAADATEVPRRTRVTLTGSVSPAAQGTEVTLQRRASGSSWEAFRSVTTQADGSVKAVVVPSAPGEYFYRFTVRGSDSLLPGFSPKVAVTVTK